MSIHDSKVPQIVEVACHWPEVTDVIFTAMQNSKKAAKQQAAGKMLDYIRTL